MRPDLGGYFSGNKLGYIIRFHETVIVVCVFLRQKEGLRRISFFIYISKIRTCVLPVYPSTAEDDPAAVATP